MNRLAAALLTLLLALALAAPALRPSPRPATSWPIPRPRWSSCPERSRPWPACRSLVHPPVANQGRGHFCGYSLYCPRCQSGSPPGEPRVPNGSRPRPGRASPCWPLRRAIRPLRWSFSAEISGPNTHDAPDADYVLHKALLSVGAPSYFVLQPLPGGKGLKVLFFHEGAFEDENAFLENVLRVIKAKTVKENNTMNRTPFQH